MHGPCLKDFQLVALGRGNKRYCKLTVLVKNCCWADSNIGNVDTRPREVEGAEGADCCRVWMSLFAQCLSNGWLMG